MLACVAVPLCIQPVCRTAKGRPIVIKETTARAFEALLHFLYSDALEVEDELLVDVLRYWASSAAPCSCIVCRPLLRSSRWRCRLADRCQAQRLRRLCLARMKAALGPEHACRWLVEVTKHSIAELQEPLLQYVTKSWSKIRDENPQCVEQLEEFPKLMSAILLAVDIFASRPTKCRRL